jgi:quercetin dioxygenase-like cupin family protein
MEGVRLTLLAGAERMNAQSFEIEPGATVPEHSHDSEQVGLVTAGHLTFLVDDEELVCGPGDSYAIPGGEPHGARNDGDETVEGVEMFSPPRATPTWESD